MGLIIDRFIIISKFMFILYCCNKMFVLLWEKFFLENITYEGRERKRKKGVGCWGKD